MSVLGWWMVVTMVRPMAANRCSFSTSEYAVDESSPESCGAQWKTREEEKI
jgi:hypothetical protein